MQITITGRHLKLTDSLKSLIEKKIQKLEHYAKPIITIHVILTVIKDYRHSVEIIAQTREAVFSGVSETEDMYASLDAALNKVKKQLKKHNEKIKDHKKANKNDIHGQMRMNIFAMEEKTQNGKTAVPKLVRSEKVSIRPMTIEDAIGELDHLGYDFLSFVNVSTEKVNVIYKRSDGQLGIIEQEF